MREVCVITSLKGTKDKGMWRVAGRPLMDWVARTAETYCKNGSGRESVISSDQFLAAYGIAEARGSRVVVPPEALRSGNCHVEQVLHAVVLDGLTDEDVIHLMQPTAPFIRVRDLYWSSGQHLAVRPEIMSVQTVVPVPHNMHAWNQREFDRGKIDFVNKWERTVNPTKQTKPKRYAFGNLVSVRYGALKEQGTFFATPSHGVVIPRSYALDVDQEEDRDLAEVYLSSGLVSEKEILA